MTFFFCCAIIFKYYTYGVLCPCAVTDRRLQSGEVYKFEQEDKTDCVHCHGRRYDNSTPESGSDMV